MFRPFFGSVLCIFLRSLTFHLLVLHGLDFCEYKNQRQKAQPRAHKVHAMKITQCLPVIVNLYKVNNLVSKF